MEFAQSLAYIRKGRIQEAFHLIEKCIDEADNAAHHEFFLLQSQFHAVKKQSLLGFQNSRTEFNRIVLALIEWISERKADFSENPELLSPPAIEKMANLSHAHWIYHMHQEFFQQFVKSNAEIIAALRSEKAPKALTENMAEKLGQLESIHGIATDIRQKLGALEKKGGDPDIISFAEKRLVYIYQEMSLVEVSRVHGELEQFQAKLARQMAKGKLPVILAAITFGVLFFLILLGIML